jgi:uncharacterized protein (UPF0261 family)
MATKTVVAVLATLDTKLEATRFMCSELEDQGVSPVILDLSFRAHEAAAGIRWPVRRALPDGEGQSDRGELARLVTAEGLHLAKEMLGRRELAGIVGLGGANGCTVACGVMRQMPAAVPKVMVTPVAATAAVQWYVAESNIAMFPTIGDIWLNRITEAALSNAATAVAAMAQRYHQDRQEPRRQRPLVGLSTFGNLQPTVDLITRELEQADLEVIHFHASGPGGRALEALAEKGELAGVLDLTTSELADELSGGVYSAGPSRLRSAGERSIPQVVVPGALDFVNFWAGEIPERYRERDFFRYNSEIWLMRTSPQEFAALGELIGQRLSAAKGACVVLIPTLGTSALATGRATDIAGKDRGSWFQPEAMALFIDGLRARWRGPTRELPLHINDPTFAKACAAEMLSLLRGNCRRA